MATGLNIGQVPAGPANETRYEISLYVFPSPGTPLDYSVILKNALLECAPQYELNFYDEENRGFQHDRPVRAKVFLKFILPTVNFKGFDELPLKLETNLSDTFDHVDITPFSYHRESQGR